MTPSAFSDKTFLFVAGQPKAGTTSVFDWLSQHPEVCGARTKEARFFLDAAYPLPRSLVFDGSNLEHYTEFFQNPAKPVLLDATPDYMFSRSFLAVAQLLPNARVVVLTRDPVDRVTSAFHFYGARGKLPKTLSLPDYVTKMASLKVKADTPVPMRVLDQCRPEYLERLREAFGDRLLVIDFDMLRDRPRKVFAQLCDFAGLPQWDGISLDASNASRGGRFRSGARVYYFLKPRLVYLMLHLKLDRLFPLMRRLNRLAERGLSKGLDKTAPDAATVAKVNAYLNAPP